MNFPVERRLNLRRKEANTVSKIFPFSGTNNSFPYVDFGCNYSILPRAGVAGGTATSSSIKDTRTHNAHFLFLLLLSIFPTGHLSSLEAQNPRFSFLFGHFVWWILRLYDCQMSGRVLPPTQFLGTKDVISWHPTDHFTILEPRKIL